MIEVGSSWLGRCSPRQVGAEFIEESWSLMRFGLVVIVLFEARGMSG